MKVFFSWSKEVSRDVAGLLHKLFLEVFDSDVELWISTRDIDAGAVWFGAIQNELKGTDVGIVVLTKENMHNPWLLFEAGALAKDIDKAHVCTVLVDMESHQVQQPLSNFNDTKFTLEGILHLARTINKKRESPLKDNLLETAFTEYFPKYISDFEKIRKRVLSKKEPKRDLESMVIEMLGLIRGMQDSFAVQPVYQRTYDRKKVEDMVKLFNDMEEDKRRALIAAKAEEEKFSIYIDIDEGIYPPIEPPPPL